MINWKDPVEAQTSDVSIDFAEPISISREVLNEQKQKFRDEALETSEKLSGNKSATKKNSKSNTSKNTRQSNSKKVKFNELKSSSAKTPVISCPEDLVGKMVLYFYERDEKEDWYKGVVIRKEGKAKKPKFYLQFCTEDEEGVDFIVSTLYEDFLEGLLTLCEVTPEEFVDASIDVLYKNDTGTETWWSAEVSDIDPDSDKNNPTP